MRNRLSLLSLIAVVGIASCAIAADAKSDAPKANKPKKVLYLTHSAGFKHSVLGLSEKIMQELGAKSNGAFEVTVWEGYKQDKDKIDLSKLTAETLKDYDAVIFYTTGELPLYYWQTEALREFVRSGKAIIGVHSATDTFYKWPEWKNIMGGYFKTHGPNDKEVTIKVVDKNHPATRMLDDEWVIADEIYHLRQPLDETKFHLLLTIDTDKTDLAPQKMEKGQQYPVSWCRNYGKGRTFYTSLGHRDDVWENPKFQEHLTGGILWALGLAPGDATPSAKGAASSK
jgi:type 1 glutamine amidotransferase